MLRDFQESFNMQVTELRKEGEAPVRHETEPSRMFIVL